MEPVEKAFKVEDVWPESRMREIRKNCRNSVLLIVPRRVAVNASCDSFALGADGRQAARVIRVPAGRRRDRRLPSRSRDPGDPDTTAKLSLRQAGDTHRTSAGSRLSNDRFPGPSSGRRPPTDRA
uniref:Uncharacterized protein n=1 Tax=Branchiostoma floridae TaxID=7739 RepID=C3YQC9_BRAFL|eukprot:XP_002601447.1 hypothetical protein BRAFLDRAFT_104396 [Branchiostoma floridae]